MESIANLSQLEASRISPDVITIAKSVEMFFAQLQLAPRSKTTYRNGIQKLLASLKRNGVDPEREPVDALSATLIVGFAKELVPLDIITPEQASQMRTAQNNLAAVRKFCTFLVTSGMSPSLPIEKIKLHISAVTPRYSPRAPEVKLTDLQKIIDYVTQSEREQIARKELRRLKVRALILFLFHTGVRVSELCALRRRDVDLEEMTATIYRPKHGKPRQVYFDERTREALTVYWTDRQDPVRGSGSLPAFSGRDKMGQAGAPISPRSVEYIVTQLCNELGIESEVTPHSFRHGLATNLIGKNVREATIQKILGHASPQTLGLYRVNTSPDSRDEYQRVFGMSTRRVSLEE